MVEAADADMWYKARVEMITVEDDGKEKRKAVSILVHGNDVKSALNNLLKYLESLDCEVVSITKSPIVEVIRAVNG